MIGLRLHPQICAEQRCRPQPQSLPPHWSQLQPRVQLPITREPKRWQLQDQGLTFEIRRTSSDWPLPREGRVQCLGRGCTPTLIRSNKALMCLEAGRERGQGPERDPAAEGHSPERPLSPPQGQRWPSWAPLPFAPTAAGAPRHQHQRRCPGPRRRPPAAGSGTGHGDAGVRVPPPARLPPPTPSAHPVPWPGPRLAPSPCQGIPASTA